MQPPELLNVLYEDDWMIAVDKPAGQLVHPTKAPQEGDEVTMKILRDQIGQRVHTLHRLDRPTTGVILFAKNKESTRVLRTTFDDGGIHKTYWAVTIGIPEKQSWTCDTPLRNEEDSPERTAVTHFRRLAILAHDLALVEALPVTGRFHQIRRHLLHEGHPIAGDYRYAGIERCDALGAVLNTGTRMLLQAKALEFTHPMTNAEVKIEAPVDPLIAKVARTAA